MSTSNREIVTLGIGSFGVLAATQWANGLSQFEVDQCSCTFDELRRASGPNRSNKAVRAVFLDQHYRSGVKAEMSVETVEDRLQMLSANPNTEVIRLFGDDRTGGSNAEQHNAAAAAASSKGSKRRHRDPLWPGHSARNLWARGNRGYDEDDDDDEEEEDGGNSDDDDDDARPDQNDGDGDSDNDDFGDNQTSDKVSQKIGKNVRQPPQAMPHHPWWQYLTAPHRPDLDRVVSFIDLPGVSESGGWSQLRSFGFGLHDSAVHAQLERGAFLDNLRKELEACDALDAIQLFVDSDSSFGGIATHLASSILCDDFGVKSTFAISCLPDPGEEDTAEAIAKRQHQFGGGAPVIDDSSVGSGAMMPATIELLFEDHRNLNRGLATSLLSQACRGYVPQEIHSWGPIFSGFPQKVLPGLNTTDDIAAASVVANWVDSVFLPCRAGVSTATTSEGSSKSDIVAVSGGAFGAGAAGQFVGGNVGIAQLMDMLRPSPTLRVAASYLALPFLKMDPANAFASYSASSGASAADSSDPRTNNNSGGDTSMKAVLFNLLDSSAPLLSLEKGTFRPLSGIVVDPSRTDTNAHAIMSHSYCLRAGLPFADDRASIREAMVQYSSGIRCGAFVGYAIREPCPLSGTFPKRIFASPSSRHPASASSSSSKKWSHVPPLRAADDVESLRTVSSGAHILTTNAAGTYLNSVHDGALRKSMNLRGEQARTAMAIDGDSWREVEEDLAALRDAYHYEPEPDANDYDDNE